MYGFETTKKALRTNEMAADKDPSPLRVAAKYIFDLEANCPDVSQDDKPPGTVDMDSLSWVMSDLGVEMKT